MILELQQAFETGVRSRVFGNLMGTCLELAFGVPMIAACVLVSEPDVNAIRRGSCITLGPSYSS